MSLIKALKEFKKEGFIPQKILDIGANVGEFTISCKEIWENSVCYMVEANKNCEKHLSKIKQPYFIEVLSEDDDKEVTFYLTKENDTCTGNSIYKEKTKHYSKEKIIEEKRKTKKIDSLFKGLSFDLIKIDTQGSELDILKGSTKTIQKAKYILIETSLKEYNIGAPLEEEVILFMATSGFKKYKNLESHIWSVEDGPFNKGEIFQRDLIFYK